MTVRAGTAYRHLFSRYKKYHCTLSLKMWFACINRIG